MDGVYENILICTREHDLGKCLVENGFTSPGSLTYLNRVEIDKLTFQKTVLDPDGSGNTTTVTSHLHHGDRGLLHAAVWYFFTLSKVKYKNDPIPYPSLIRAEFDLFRTNEYRVYAEQGSEAMHTRPAHERNNTDHALFLKHVRRDVKAFPEFKNEKEWDRWSLGMITECETQHLSNILNPDYAGAAGDRALFDEHQKFMYNVFFRTVQTSAGMAIVTSHAIDRDAQAIWRELCARAKTSTQASQNTEAILKYLTTAKVEGWSGTTYDFVLHWLERVRIFNTMVTSTEHLSLMMLNSLLRTSVRNIGILANVENTAEIMKVAGTEEVTFEAYTNLLFSACSTHDSQFQAKNRQRPNVGNRNANPHHTAYGPFDVNTDIDIVSANMSRLEYDTPVYYNPPTPIYDVNLTKQQWKALSPESQGHWDKLSPDEKNIIAGRPSPPQATRFARPPSSNGTRTPSSYGNRSPDPRPPLNLPNFTIFRTLKLLPISTT